MRPVITVVLLTAALASAAAAPEGIGPFTPDEHTLLLARYDAGVDAEVAIADPRAQGQSLIREGLFTGAMHATKGWLTPEATVADIEAFPFFKPVTYARGNLNARSGCLEMFVNFEHLVNPEYFRRVMTWESGIYYGTGYVILALRPGEDRTLQLLVKSPDGGETTLSAPYPNDWNDQWHHIGFQWDAETYGLIIDGEVASLKPAVAEGMPAPDTRISIGAHMRGVNVANALIDELRISDVPRY
ncbi:MAG: LamG domain-containing protein [candidate division WS1 bacterium]|jgi:hypothetical protein|nr:LamG domain-containing protein [candidate division WS1 bacterium]